MACFLDQLRAGFHACEATGTGVLLAVSGGADSVALLRAALSLRDELRLDLTAAHLIHGLRGAAATEDARWVEDLCGRLNVPVVIGRADVPQAAAQSGRGTEETARIVRYEFLKESARSHGLGQIAAAHTADDQAETILHQIIRGSGLAGAAGMPRRRSLGDRIDLIRPMLDVRRSEVERWLAGIGQDFRTDATNLDERHTRNRIRQGLMPLLRREFNAEIHEALLRLGRQAGEAQGSLEFCARRLLDTAVLETGEAVCRFDCKPLAEVPRHLLRTCFVLLWQDLGWPRQGMGYEHWERLAEVAISGGAVTLPGDIEARRRGNMLVLRRNALAGDRPSPLPEVPPSE